MTDPHGPAQPDEPQAPQFGASAAGDASPAAPAPGEPAQPFSSPAPGAVPPAGTPQSPYAAPGQHVPPQQPQPGAPQHGAPQYGAPQYGAPGQPHYQAGAPMTPQDEKQWAMLGHLGGIAWVIGLGWLGPLIVFLMYKDRSAFVRQESREALNFQLLMTIVAVGGSIVVSLLTAITFGLAAVLYVLVWAAPIVGIVFAIIGGVRVNGGGSYRYPFSWRIVT